MIAKTYYVTMTDKVFSGWGMARGKINKLVISCNSFAEAQVVMANAERRHEMKHINILDHKPYYSQDRYFTSYHGRIEGDYESWFDKHEDWR